MVIPGYSERYQSKIMHGLIKLAIKFCIYLKEVSELNLERLVSTLSTSVYKVNIFN